MDIAQIGILKEAGQTPDFNDFRQMGPLPNNNFVPPGGVYPTDDQGNPILPGHQNQSEEQPAASFPSAAASQPPAASAQAPAELAAAPPAPPNYMASVDQALGLDVKPQEELQQYVRLIAQKQAAMENTSPNAQQHAPGPNVAPAQENPAVAVIKQQLAQLAQEPNVRAYVQLQAALEILERMVR